MKCLYYITKGKALEMLNKFAKSCSFLGVDKVEKVNLLNEEFPVSELFIMKWYFF